MTAIACDLSINRTERVLRAFTRAHTYSVDPKGAVKALPPLNKALHFVGINIPFLSLRRARTRRVCIHHRLLSGQVAKNAEFALRVRVRNRRARKLAFWSRIFRSSGITCVRARFAYAVSRFPGVASLLRPRDAARRLSVFLQAVSILSCITSWDDSPTISGAISAGIARK